MAEWSGSYIAALPDSAFACLDDAGRHYPHHNADGDLDLPHLRNALSRVAQEATTSCGVAHLRSHARAEEVGETRSLAAVKFVGRDTIEGLAIPYGGTMAGGKDLLGEAFDANTDLCLDWFGKSGRPVLYDHGFDDAIKTNVVGRQVDMEERATGVWAQSQLDKNAKYRKAVDMLIEQEALGYSSGSMQHLATKNRASGIITRWPWVELSLTPFPAEPSTLGVYYVKSAQAALDLLEVEASEPLRAALAALDEWAAHRPDDGAESPLDAREFSDDSTDVASVRVKSGRVLSASNRQRLARHPGLLRELADDLDQLLSEADGKAPTAKSIADLAIVAARLDARLLGVPEGEPTT